MARGGVFTASRAVRPARAGVVTLLLLVLAAALCTKVMGSAAASAPPQGGSDAVAHADASPAAETANSDPGDGTRCAKKPPSTQAHAAPETADAAVAHVAAMPDRPRRADVARFAGVRAGLAPPASRHILLSVLRI